MLILPSLLLMLSLLRRTIVVRTLIASAATLCWLPIAIGMASPLRSLLLMQSLLIRLLFCLAPQHLGFQHLTWQGARHRIQVVGVEAGAVLPSNTSNIRKSRRGA